MFKLNIYCINDQMLVKTMRKKIVSKTINKREQVFERSEKNAVSKTKGEKKTQ
jgi:hypothetical protein